jgi:Co/Zn/Cd efflux system component
MGLFGASVFLEAIAKALHGAVPDSAVMGLVGALALGANAACLLLLLRHREDDINMRSAWICSRNDIIANGAVIIAAFAVNALGSLWPDLIVGVAMAALFVLSAVGVWREGRKALAAARDAGSAQFGRGVR